MSPRGRRAETLAALTEYLVAPRFVTALTSTIIGAAILSFALRQTIGWAGFLAIIGVLTVVAGLSIIARWNTIEWRGILPISLLVFVAWASLSLVWSNYKWVSLGALAYLGCFTVLGLYIALLRDTIQIVRSFGDALRFTLGLSVAIEVIAGVLIDSPISFLRVSGRLDELGPIQGVAGTRNQLAILAVVALITFATEYRTRSVSQRLAVGSLLLGGATLALTRSPLGIGATFAVLIAAAALYRLRRVGPDRKRYWQIGLLLATAVAAAAAWAFRSVIVSAVDANAELSYRLDVWREAWILITLNPLQGWGWMGIWREDIPPYTLFQQLSARTETSASNAFVDIWLQLGLVGLVVFIGLAGLGFVRSWLLASRQRSVVFAWPALVLFALIVTALAESSLLVEFGWMTFVACTVKAAEQLSWRRALGVDRS